MAFRIGQVAPQGITITVTQAQSGYDMSTVTSATIFAHKPNGSIVQWTAFISAQSSASITVDYQFLTGDVQLTGFWQFYAILSTPGGPIESEPFRQQCFPQFDDAVAYGLAACASPTSTTTSPLPIGVRVPGGGTVTLAPDTIASCDPGGAPGGGCTVKASPLTVDFSTYEVFDRTGTASISAPMTFGYLTGWAVELPSARGTFSALGGFVSLTQAGADVIWRADAVLKRFNIAT